MIMFHIYFISFSILTWIYAIEVSRFFNQYQSKRTSYNFELLALPCIIPFIINEDNDIKCMDVIPERAKLSYFNPKYVFNESVTVRRYSRKSRYCINVLGTNIHTWANNVTIAVEVSQLLHNEFRPSFVKMKHKFCDLVNKEPFVGGALKNAGVVCPLLPGYHAIANITAATENFPNVFPFEKGRIEINLATITGETILQFYIVASFKQKIL